MGEKSHGNRGWAGSSGPRVQQVSGGHRDRDGIGDGSGTPCPCNTDFWRGLYQKGWRCHSKPQIGYDRPKGWTLVSLPGEIRLDSNIFLQCCGGSGEGGSENREGTKPLLCFSSSNLAPLAEPSGTCGIHIAWMAYGSLMGKLRQGKVVV